MRQLSTDASVLVSRREIPAWVTSLVLHLMILAVLGSITRLTVMHRERAISSTISEIESLEPEEFKFDATIIDQVGAETDTNTLTPSLAAAEAATPEPQEQVERQVEKQFLTVEAPPLRDMLDLQDEVLLEQIDTKGSTEHTGGVEGAIDWLTYEIAGSLKEHKTLVIWLFDASLSLKERREAIADRFENVYRQLGQLKVGQEGALKTAVVSFGQQTNFITPEPVNDYREMVDAVRNIKPDEKGVENVFSAVAQATEKWKKYATRLGHNVMVVIVTDERGDDVNVLEAVIGEVRRFGMRVYCVGNAAVFGREQQYVQWRYDDGETVPVGIDRGPESARLERLKLAFWGSAPGHLENLSAGFGPYALTRLCAESGGLYLLTEETGMRFDPETMRNYRPDYVPIRDYDNELDKNRAKGALVRAAEGTSATAIPRPRLQFRADSDNILRQQLTEAQKPLADLDYHLREMHSMLEYGEKDRPALNEARWRAGFDLAIGRVLAMRVRAFGYNVMLAEMKSSPKSFQKPNSNMWRLVAADELPGDPSVKKLAGAAREYLTRVVDSHPGTPWAEIAEVELSQPMGWRWQEGHMNIPSTQNDPENNRRLLLAEEQMRRRSAPQPKPKPRVKPKL